jgi:hypothetical protein
MDALPKRKKNQRAVKPAATRPLRYTPRPGVFEGCDLRLHLLFPLEAWVRGSDRSRLDFLRAYLDSVTGARPPGLRDIIVLPAGFHRAEDAGGARRTMETEFAGYRGRTVLLRASIDTPGEPCREYSYRLDLSGPSIGWPVFVEKFNRAEPRGNREDARSCLWQGIEVFSLCCMVCTCTLGGHPPDSLTWSAGARFHVVLDNAHYSGPRDQGLWRGIGRASPLARGLGQLVTLPEVTGGRPGVAAIAFFAGDDPLGRTARWWYPTPDGVSVARRDDFSTGDGPERVWHRILHFTL